VPIRLLARADVGAGTVAPVGQEAVQIEAAWLEIDGTHVHSLTILCGPQLSNLGSSMLCLCCQNHHRQPQQGQQPHQYMQQENPPAAVLACAGGLGAKGRAGWSGDDGAVVGAGVVAPA
jgi:hypothetical protein